MSEICAQYDSVRPSIIDKLFAGIQQTKVVCGRCGYQSLTYNPFMTISLQYKPSLVSAIEDSLSEVRVDGNYKCDKCRKESKAKVSHEFVRLPKYLIFHVKRFNSMFTKITQGMDYPARLNLSNFQEKSQTLGSTWYELFGLTVH